MRAGSPSMIVASLFLAACSGGVVAPPDASGGFTTAKGAGGAPSCALWSKSYAGAVGKAVGLDTSGDVFVAGKFAAPSDFGDGVVTPAGGFDVFVTKLNASGEHLWSRHFGGPSVDQAFALAVDPKGGVFVAGQVSGAVDLGGGALVTQGENGAFVAKYDANGAHVWSKLVNDPKYGEGLAAAADAAGNVVTGFIGSTQAFAAKYGSDGALLWTAQFAGLAIVIVDGVGIDDAGDVVVVGSYNGTPDFGGGPLLAATSDQRAFVVKLTGAGAHVWSKTFAESGQGQALLRSVAVDGSGDILIAGDADATIDFGNGPLGPPGMFLAKLTGAGDEVWAKRLGHGGQDEASAVAINPKGNVLLTGFVAGPIDFGGGLLPTIQQPDAFIAEFTADGAYASAGIYGATGTDWGHAIATAQDGHVVVTGEFGGTIDFCGHELHGGGAFVAALRP